MPSPIEIRFLRETYRILEATDTTEYVALSDAQKELYKIIISSGKVNLAEDTLVRTILWNMFSEGTTTRTNLDALLPEEPVEIP